MTELARLDAINLHMAKTTFVASISHELRSPLHGVLGSIQFLQDTALDAFQVSMLSKLTQAALSPPMPPRIQLWIVPITDPREFL